MKHPLNGNVAIVGIGATEFSKNSGRSELQLAVEAITSALADAGLTGSMVDGLCTYTADNSPETEVFRLIGGKELKYFARSEYSGGGACAPILHAATAIVSKVCDVAVVYRAMNERSQYRFGDGQLAFELDPNSFNGVFLTNWWLPYGLFSPMAMLALTTQRYMHEYGATSEDLGRVAVAQRDFASTNPKAFFYDKPLTLLEHQTSRWISRPLRLPDCCQESDGAVALVLTASDRALDLKRRPAYIRGVAQGATRDTGMFVEYHGSHGTQLPEKKSVARQLYKMANLGPRDIQSAVLYDHCTAFVLMQLEACGFCGVGEAKDFVRDGHTARSGSLPVNPHGGLIGEAYIHGMNGVAEGVRQVRGSAVNQVPDIEHVLVTGGDGLPTSGLILGRSPK